MKILFFTTPVEDYLGDAVLIGLRKIYGADCIDFPKQDILYRECPEHMMHQVRGNGFTLYTGLLEDIAVDRFNIEYKLENNYFDLIIFSDIQRQFGWFLHFRPWLHMKNTLIMDGFDTPHPYPARGRWWRKPYYWFLPTAHRSFLYFKREWTPNTYFHLWMRFLPTKLRSFVSRPKNLRTIAFSMPEEKIIAELPRKIKDFPKHIVDPEVAAQVGGSYTSYAFEKEQAYYEDLRQSRFGITTKREGWDCLRHYEIAANGAVMCFKDLDEKPATCAPHGLVDSVNCIAYKDYNDLKNKIDRLTPAQYEKLQRNSLQWARNNSSMKRAEELLEFFPQIKKAI